MSQQYLQVIQSTNLETLLTLPHKHVGAHPTGFVVQMEEPFPSFPFTVCPLQFCTPGTIPSGLNPHDVIVPYRVEDGNLETLLYSLYEEYKNNHLEQKGKTMKVYRYEQSRPRRKIIIPCLGRKENLIATLKRLQTIDLPVEGYRPLICIVEHSPYPELELIAKRFHCEYLWLLLDPRNPSLPIGQFNKALCYDKAFLFTSPANWYLFHDNDVLVPRDFWRRLDENVARANVKFVQPYTYRSLLNTIPEVAQRLRENVDLADEKLEEGMFTPIREGAPGGSLYLHRSRYLEVGGHDANFCWGYGPEDAFFFSKCEMMEPIAYADDPPIEMIHLWHPSAAPNNPFLREMDWFVKVYFAEKSEGEKRAFLKSKESLLEQILSQIEQGGYNKA